MSIKQRIEMYLKNHPTEELYMRLRDLIPGKDNHEIRAVQAEIKATEKVCNDIMNIINNETINYPEPSQKEEKSDIQRMLEVEDKARNLSL